MANTYTQIHIQVVYAVKYRESMILPSFKDRLHHYITGIVHNRQHRMLAVNSMPDHMHLLIELRPHESLASLIGKVKGESTEWINEEKLTRGHFRWQEGYGAFSYAKSQVPTVIKYILNQEEHHRKKTFEEEYTKLLKESEVDFDSRYIFKSPE